MKVIPCQIKRNSNIFLMGDRHIGNAARSEEGFKQFIDMVNSEYEGVEDNYIVDHGDVIEAISSDDKRFEKSVHDTLPFDEIDLAIEENKCIADKIITILIGNHEYKWRRFGDLATHIVQYTNKEYNTNIEYGTNSCIIVYRDEDNRYLFRHHAWHPMKGQLRSLAKDPDQEIGNLLAALKMKLKHLMGNCLIQSCGHFHQLLVNEPKEQLLQIEKAGKVVREYATARKVDGYIHPDYRWYCATGSFLSYYKEGISTYPERSGFKPTDLGFAIVKVREGNIDGIDPIKMT